MPGVRQDGELALPKVPVGLDTLLHRAEVVAVPNDDQNEGKLTGIITVSCLPRCRQSLGSAASAARICAR